MRNSFLLAGAVWGAIAVAMVSVVTLQAAFGARAEALAAPIPSSDIAVSLSQQTIPAVPNTSEATSTLEGTVGPITETPVPKYISSLIPIKVEIPAAGIEKTVIGVGVNKKGEMDVPSGESDYVGWYKHGAKPGAKGVAVMDAHVYAAFKNLKHVEVGDNVYVYGEGGIALHFRVTKVATYKLANLTPSMLFTGVGTSGRYLNFITCAGTYSTKLGTYSHRLIVFAELVE